MTWIPVALALALCGSPGAPTAARPIVVVAEREIIRVLRVDAAGLSSPALREELALRIPEVKVIAHDGRGRIPADHLYARVELRDQIVMTAIAGDGRAFDRQVDPGEDPPVRVAAASLANLVFAIQEGTVGADRTRVKVPGTDEDRHDGENSGEGETRNGDGDSGDRHEDGDADADADADAAGSPARWSLGAGGAVGFVLTPGPPSGADVFGGWTGGVRLAARSPAGDFAMVGFLPTGRSAGEVGVLRFRTTLGGGRTWRVSGVELALGAFVTMEPWTVTRDGRPAELLRGGRDRTSVLLGGHAHLAAGYLFAPGPRTRLRVGPWADLGGSFAVGDGGPTVPIVVDDDGRRRLRAGGLELHVGLEAMAWFSLQKRQ